MKILYVITGLGQGGAERVVCDLADKMYERGHEVKVAYLLGDALTTPRHANIELIKINLAHMLALPGAYLCLARLINRYKPNVVHSHMVHANLLTRLVRPSSPMQKLISTAHSNNEGGTLRMMLYRFTHNLSNVTTNVSQGASQAFEQKKAVPVGGIKTVYNGIDLDKFKYDYKARDSVLQELSLTIATKIILAVGRFNEAKDYPNLLNAVALLKEKNTKLDFKLLIAGDGELRTAIEALISELNLTHDVILLGRRVDIPRLMSAADLFVLPSKYEGFGLVVAEAMACRCPVVATNSGGVSEVIGGYGAIVEPCNPLLLAHSIGEALSMPDSKRLEIIESGYEHVQKKFNLNSIINVWEGIYLGE